ncbi:MAG: rod shape-determining protein MreC [SAR324 cluster bacterium]|nr:rod shape-determining protein MreC [SAR324 cluster bacterium]
MVNFFKKIYFRLAVIIALFSLAIMVFSHSRRDNDYILGDFFYNITTPLLGVVTSFANGIENSLDHYIFLSGVYEKNLILNQTITDLKVKNERLTDKLASLDQFKESIHFQSINHPTKIHARVVSEMSGNYSRLLVINKGSDHAVKKNQGVVGYKGVIGKIIRVNRKYSLVQLVTDSQLKMPALIAKNKQRAFLQGDGDRHLLLKLLPREERVAVGDKIITSDIISIFPSGYEIGEVISVYQKEFSWFQEAKVKVTNELDKLEDVFIIKNDESDKILEFVKSLDIATNLSD